MNPKELPSQERLKELFEYNESTGIFTRKVSLGSRSKVGSIAGTIAATGYHRIRIDGKQYQSHRLAWRYVYGTDPGNSEIDHINGVKDDNRISNLRLADRAENNWNTRSKGQTGYKGVSFNKKVKKYHSQIIIRGKYKHLGYYDTAEEASIAYNSYAKEHQKVFFCHS